jgi:5-methylcytosine-specific restriction protein A
MGDQPRKYHELNASHTDPGRIKREREKARELRKTQWWRDQLNRGICHHCGKKFASEQLTMDHLVPLARGGTSAKGNIVCSCRSCNQDKKLEMPVDSLFEQLERERRERGERGGTGEDEDV